MSGCLAPASAVIGCFLSGSLADWLPLASAGGRSLLTGCVPVTVDADILAFRFEGDGDLGHGRVNGLGRVHLANRILYCAGCPKAC